MKSPLFLALSLLIFTSCDCVQNISGIVIDRNTGEPVEGIVVYHKYKEYTSITNDSGYFEISSISGGFTCPPMTIFIDQASYEYYETEVPAGGSITIILERKSALYDLKALTSQMELNLLADDKTGILAKDGTSFSVDESKQKITAVKGGEILWKVDILEDCGDPQVGNSGIRYIKLVDKQLIVIFGKHASASIQTKSGKVTCLGSD